MTSKSNPAHNVRFQFAYRDWFGREQRSWYQEYRLGANTITYSDGKMVRGHWPWKECTHINEGSANPGGTAITMVSAPWEQSPWVDEFTLMPQHPGNLPSAPAVTGSMIDRCVGQCLNQIDLNTSDAVLLYSGVYQAVPLLGSVFKLNRILRDVSEHVSKRLRRKPFTTVIKDLISLDFIDRFVISPTLADARKFQDACDYVLRVLDTARTRNKGPFALTAVDQTVVSEKGSNGYFNGGGGDSAYVGYRETTTTGVDVKAFMLCEGTYDLSAASPIAIWAQRVGLTRPLDSVWDLVPFSFVVDYFTRAGDFISHLSDEMSSVDGLKGRITAIRDLWITTTSYSRCKRKPYGFIQNPSVPGGCTLDLMVFDTSPAETTKESFRRFPMYNAWDYCMRLMSQPENYLSINLGLSQTRIRTLAELVIQAKL